MKFFFVFCTMLFGVASVFSQDFFANDDSIIADNNPPSLLSPSAATGLIAGPDSLAIPIAVTLPATLYYTQLSHTNITSALAATIMYSTNGGATWSSPILINGGMNHASLAAGTVTIKSIAGKLVVSVSGSYSSPSSGFYTTTWVVNAPVAAITHVKFGTNMTSPAGLKLDGGGTYVLE